MNSKFVQWSIHKFGILAWEWDHIAVHKFGILAWEWDHMAVHKFGILAWEWDHIAVHKFGILAWEWDHMAVHKFGILAWEWDHIAVHKFGILAWEWDHIAVHKFGILAWEWDHIAVHKFGILAWEWDHIAVHKFGFFPRNEAASFPTHRAPSWWHRQRLDTWWRRKWQMAPLSTLQALQERLVYIVLWVEVIVYAITIYGLCNRRNNFVTMMMILMMILSQNWCCFDVLFTMVMVSLPWTMREMNWPHNLVASKPLYSHPVNYRMTSLWVCNSCALPTSDTSLHHCLQKPHVYRSLQVGTTTLFKLRLKGYFTLCCPWRPITNTGQMALVLLWIAILRSWQVILLVEHNKVINWSQVWGQPAQHTSELLGFFSVLILTSSSSHLFPSLCVYSSATLANKYGLMLYVWC